MVNLTQRLRCIANFIQTGETMADIGTDHGFLPIYLWQRGISPHVVLSDVKKGPLQKAANNIALHCSEHDFDVRLGSGIQTLKKGEVDDVVIAGMGGLLIADILADDLEKSHSFHKLVLQPRNAQEKLRKWLLEHDFLFLDEVLVREGKYIWEVMLVTPRQCYNLLQQQYPQRDIITPESGLKELDYELNPLLFRKKDPLLQAYLENKIRIEEGILQKLEDSQKERAQNRAAVVMARRNKLIEVWERLQNDREGRI